MKKLLIVIATLAMIVSFLPNVEAGETATLGLRVTFVDLDRERVLEISAALDEIAVKAEWYYKNAVESGDPQVIKEAIDVLRELHGDYIKPYIEELNEIADRRPDLKELIEKVVDKAVDLLRTIDGYIEHLMSLLYPLKIWSEPEGPFKVKEGEELRFQVIAEDKDTDDIKLVAHNLPEGAQFVVMRPIPPLWEHRVEGTFTWTPKQGQVQDEPYVVVFEATNEEGEVARLKVEITVVEGQIISIVLKPDEWLLEGVKLGERRSNLDEYGKPIHNIKNTGNVDVMVDIGYGPYITSGVQPGMEQGKDTFTTKVRPVGARSMLIIPPNERVKVSEISPDTKVPLELMYGAPTGLSEGVQGHKVSYELRAYGMNNEDPLE